MLFLEDFKHTSELMVEIYDLKATNKELQNQFNDFIQLAKRNRKVFKLGKNTFSIRKKYTELEIKLKTRKSF
jgi:hypothetical protein